MQMKPMVYLALAVNALGEVIVKAPSGELVPIIGSVTLPELKQRLKRTPTDADVKNEFQRMVDKSILTPLQKRMVKLVWQAQDRLNNERIRVQYYSGAVRVTTELLYPVADKAFWRKVREVRRELGASLTVMDETVNEDGVLERQVDLNLPVRPPSLPEIRKAYNAMDLATEEIWETCGVSVS